MDAQRWIHPTPQGLFVPTGGFYIDPPAPVARAVITHGHSDHARPGHAQVLATPETLAIMRHRLGDAMGAAQALPTGESITVGGVRLRLAPAGHILGAAQVVLEHAGQRVVVSGDYKRVPDPTCVPFEPVECDVFVTEATFGLPVFRHPDPGSEIARLLHSVKLFPERCHLVGVYALGKCQRVLALLRASGYEDPIYLHGALAGLTELYEAHGQSFGVLRAVTDVPRGDLMGAIVLAPPSALGDRWSRRLPDPVPALCSGWMRVKQRAKQQGVELPLVISDHADWDELTRTIEDVRAPEIWVTHGREEALVHHAATRGLRARALALVGYEEEDT
jgi:putative mRNA 3-end processing factor